MAEQVDVIVLGTGAAGLTAAMAAHDGGASVMLLEKGDLVGGTSAMSGAMIWLPANARAADAGVDDSRADALTYLDSLSLGYIAPEMAAAFVDTVPALLDWLDTATPLRLELMARYPDYHPEHPGGKSGGRSLEPIQFAMDRLNGWADRIVAVEAPDGMTLRISESAMGGVAKVDQALIAERRANRVQARGRALIAGLLRGCLDRGIEPRLNRRATGLTMNDGHVTGVTVETTEGAQALTARRGVIIATGGFEQDAALVKAFLRGPAGHFPTCPTNSGDGLNMAMRAGAALGMMREAWWVPVAITGTKPDGSPRASLILRERTVPGSILVNRAGKRFVNEAANYNALGAAFHAFDVNRFDYANLPCWLILDQACLDTYGFVHVPPGGDPGDLLVRADTLAELAGKLGIDGAALEQTVATWNADAAAGDDRAFDRGKSVYDGWSGDQRHYPTPAATLGPIAKAPFYAIEIHPSALGTKGGPLTDVDGAVLRSDGMPIPGLYAAGNAMAGPTGMVYGGAGGTLGPAMVFAYRAGRHAAGANAAAEGGVEVERLRT